jgi:hypothetical protein
MMQSSSAYASQSPSVSAAPFVDRRRNPGRSGQGERRQFASSHQGLSEEARELAMAIDGYKLQNRRRYITFEEMLHVIHSLGYTKTTSE